MDVVVVGAGASGAVVSHTLSERGFRVICLEQGDWISPSDFPGNQPEWELLTQHQWAHDPNLRELPADYPLEVSDTDLEPVMQSAVGGSTIKFGALWNRLLPSDFQVASLDGVADDWPISYHDLWPYYDEVDRFVGASGFDGDTAYPPGLEYPLPPHPLGAIGLRAAKACNELGWHWWPGANAIVSHKHKTLEPCAQRGVCVWGCPEGAKASFDLIYMPQALQAGLELITGARVRQILMRPDGLAEGVVWIDRDGEEHRQPASAVVMCANGIGTPRLLLASATDSHPDGLANSSGLVGRNLMLHPNSSVTGTYEEDLQGWRGPRGQLVHSMEFYDTDRDRGFVRGLKMHALSEPGPLGAVTRRHALPYDETWGAAFHDTVRRQGGNMLWGANTEDLPEEQNRVVLDSELTDSDGIPAPKIHYRISDNTRAILKYSVERMEEVHRAAGAIETFPVEVWPDEPGHLLGTARMGDDPATSVVDSYGRCHDVQNLFIADGSIFVTSGSANPTNTIAALALRVGRQLADTASLAKVAQAR